MLKGLLYHLQVNNDKCLFLFLQDLLMISYLSSLTKTQLALGEKLSAVL